MILTAFNEILHWTPLFYFVELENVIFELIDFKHSHCGTWKVCENSKYEMFFCFKLPEFLLGSFSCKTIYFLNVSAYCKSPPAVVFSQSQSILSSLWSVPTDRVYSETWINHHSLGKSFWPGSSIILRSLQYVSWIAISCNKTPKGFAARNMNPGKRKLRRRNSVFGRSKDDTFQITNKGRRKGANSQTRWVN